MMPSEEPTMHPSEMPSIQPSVAPSEVPTAEPSMAPNPPTIRPTPMGGQPTASPTHQITYTFSVTQVLNNINAENFKGDINNTIAFKEAVAMAIPPLTSDNVDVYNVVDITSGRRLRALTEDSVDVYYSITYSVAETGYNDATTAYKALNASLYTAIVTTDLFNGYIQVVAATNNYNAPDLLETTSNSYTATEASKVSTDDDNKPLPNDHTNLIVGLVVGLGGGLLLIALIAFCVFGMGNRSSRNSSPSSVTANEKEAAVNGQI